MFSQEKAAKAQEAATKAAKLAEEVSYPVVDCDCDICQDRLMPERKPRSLKMASCLVLSGLALPGLAWPGLVLSCLVLSGLVLSCLAWPGLVLSFAWSGLAWPALVLSCLVLSCLILSCLLLVVAVAGGCKHHVKRRSIERDEPDRGDVRGATQKTSRLLAPFCSY